jgi:MYXO-CTERM domain-containing protein
MEITYGTNQGTIDIELLDDQVPATARNFLNYAGRHAYQGGYSNSIIHRTARNYLVAGAPIFAIQGGGHTFFPNPFIPDSILFQRITAGDAIRNEFSPSRPNIRGTISMAKLGGQPDSATSEWFINVTDNPFLDDPSDPSGGYTVFGHVLAGMDVVDEIASLPIYNGAAQPPNYAAFGELPTYLFDPAAAPLKANNLVLVSNIPNIKSATTSTGTLTTFTADVDMVFDTLQTVDTNTALTWLTSFTSPPDESVHFNNGMFTLTLSGVMGANGRSVTLYDVAATRPTRYYAYGKTPDDPSPHWYDFTFDGETGAEIRNDRIILHFVDGKRGDDDLDSTNGSVTHTGAQAVVTDITTSSSQSGGCSIASTPSPTMRGGDWAMVSLFLGMLALIRRRVRLQVQHERVTNITSP